MKLLSSKSLEDEPREPSGGYHGSQKGELHDSWVTSTPTSTPKNGSRSRSSSNGGGKDNDSTFLGGLLERDSSLTNSVVDRMVRSKIEK